MKDENISGTMHILAVPDLDTTARYYESVLGFTAHDVGDPGWKILQRGNMRIMAGHCPDAIAPAETGDHSYFAYVHVQDANALALELMEKDVDWIKTLTDEPWGMREFGIRTIDGHRIMFGQQLE